MAGRLLIPAAVSVMFTIPAADELVSAAESVVHGDGDERFMSLQGVGRMMAVPGLRDAT
ncbi:MAG: hypothetical protein JO197_13590 [Acidobacteria bacterium]|nr:hypothetical protein [Acidobacteriota bacterium]MBV9477729.1 hypothetical protein [Acidobacteriota bacterium]